MESGSTRHTNDIDCDAAAMLCLQPVKNFKIVKSNRHKYFIAFADDNPLVHVRIIIIIIIQWSRVQRWHPPTTFLTYYLRWQRNDIYTSTQS